MTMKGWYALMIKVDISNVWGDISLPDLLNAEKEVFDAHMTLTQGTGYGSEYRGWLDLPVAEETEEISRIRTVARRIRSDSDVLVVIGIGGSYLGPRAAIELMQGCNHNMGKGKGNPQILYAGNNLSTRSWNELPGCWRARTSPFSSPANPAPPLSLPSPPGRCAGYWNADTVLRWQRSALMPLPTRSTAPCGRWLRKKAGRAS